MQYMNPDLKSKALVIMFFTFILSTVSIILIAKLIPGAHGASFESVENLSEFERDQIFRKTFIWMCITSSVAMVYLAIGGIIRRLDLEGFYDFWCVLGIAGWPLYLPIVFLTEILIW